MNDPQHIPPTKARAGVKVGPMRYVLGISLAAVVVGLLIAFFVV